MPLMNGRTIEDVGDSLDGDLLGDDPVGTGTALCRRGRHRRSPSGCRRAEPVHLSYGEESGEEYVRQLAADHLIHAWDLAAATGGDRSPRPRAGRRGGGLVRRARGALPRRRRRRPARRRVAGDAADRAAGRVRTGPRVDTAAALTAFSAAFGSGDVDAIMALMTDDCVFEVDRPRPGRRTPRPGRPTCARSGWSSSAQTRTPRSPRRSRSWPATAACCAGGSTGPNERRLAGARARRRRAAVPGRAGRREAVLRQGLTALRSRSAPLRIRPVGFPAGSGFARMGA